MSATNGNGSRRWTVEKDDLFLEDQEQLEAEHSRLGDVFAVIERLFEAIPNLNAVQSLTIRGSTRLAERWALHRSFCITKSDRTSKS